MTTGEEILDKTMLRAEVPALDELIGRKWNVGHDGGFVQLVDYFGNDAAIVQAARVSYGRGTKAVSDDRNLIRYLMRHRHTTPFEMCELKIHVKVPMDTWRQWIRHRTASVNEYSTRYSEAIEDTATTLPGEWRSQSQTNKQGSGEFLGENIGNLLSGDEKDLHAKARQIYQYRLDKGVAREQARKDLPLSTFTEAYWKIDLHNLLHTLSLRMDSHAQIEIRSYFDIIGKEIVARWVPITWSAFCDYRLEALTLSGPEVEFLKARFTNDTSEAERLLSLIGKREREELNDKLRRLGL